MQTLALAISSSTRHFVSFKYQGNIPNKSCYWNFHTSSLVSSDNHLCQTLNQGRHPIASTVILGVVQHQPRTSAAKAEAIPTHSADLPISPSPSHPTHPVPISFPSNLGISLPPFLTQASGPATPPSHLPMPPCQPGTRAALSSPGMRIPARLHDGSLSS